MLNYYLAAMASMLRSSQRPAGRSWVAELICRTLRLVLHAPENKNLPRLRKLIESATLWHPAIRQVSYTQTVIAGVPCVIMAPKQAGNTVIVYLHGGGYVFGSPKSHRALSAQLALNSNATVISVDYRLAPEHPYPAAQQDTMAVVEQVFAQHATHKKILAGDSAGGALAIMAALRLAKQSAAIQADGCALISPWVDPLASTGTMQSHLDFDYLSDVFAANSYQALMNDQTDEIQTRFTKVDLSLLPPTLIQSGDVEVFHDQIKDFVQRAQGAGVKLEHQLYAAQFHDFQLLSPLLKEARTAVTALGVFIDQL